MCQISDYAWLFIFNVVICFLVSCTCHNLFVVDSKSEAFYKSHYQNVKKQNHLLRTKLSFCINLMLCFATITIVIATQIIN
jgi:hypothetical protein